MNDFFDAPNDSESIRRYSTLLAWMFSTIKLSRGDKTNGTYEVVELPVVLTGGQVYHKAKRLNQSPEEVKRYRNILPRAGLEFISILRDPQRLTNRHAKITHMSPDVLKGQNNRTAYNFAFRLTCKVKTRAEAYQLMELMAVKFNPYVSLTINDASEVGVKQDIVIDMADVGYDDNWEGSFEEAREILIPFDFTVKGYIYDTTHVTEPVREVKIDLDADGYEIPAWIKRES